MKKTLLALAIAATATSVNAAEIYSNDDTKVSLKGEVDIYLSQSEVDETLTKTVKNEADVSTWAKIQLDAEQKLNDTFTGFASFEIESDGSDAKFDDVLVGFKTDTWGMAFGETGDLAESADAIQKDDITNEGNYMGSTGGHHRESTGKGVVFKGQFVEGFTIVADINTDSTEDVDNTYGISADYAFSNFSIGASYITGDAEKDVDYSLAGVSASAEFGGLYLAATYAQFEGNKGYGYWKITDVSGKYGNGETMGVAAAYQIDAVRLYTTYAVATTDELSTSSGTEKISDIDSTNLVVGVDYAFRDNILFLAEYQTGDFEYDSKTLDADGVIAGVYYSF
ncbi:putative outer membrane porin protein locus of qsr prophage [Vibrio chagasii]|jgi:outer membrane porin protein LC|uniref:porin n=1 Tax=Vibrio TaxID=662 RepID=UPI0006310B9D|nr:MULTISPECIES: porin [Vibrio]MDE9379793.1 porin [Vibrio alginolyticus]MCG9604948.1 porin [Vibrio chagasii]MCK8073869.1 porin [Vibrio sp. 1CM23M]MCK8075952.1 porin [Vibrio sp. 1CM2L]MCY9863536.1 porin [Vibrio coralliirubri]